MNATTLADTPAEVLEPGSPGSPEESGQVTYVTVPPAVDPNAGWFTRLIQRIERKLSTLSTKNNFWHRTLARVFLPLAWRSGIKQLDQAGHEHFTVLLPFRRFNKNWYNAMAGAALLANSEVAAGMCIFQKVGGEYTVVCKELNYRFLRPCLGPAIYRVDPQVDIDQLKRQKVEFNVPVEMGIFQAVVHRDEKQRRRGQVLRRVPRRAQGQAAGTQTAGQGTLAEDVSPAEARVLRT